tara:strand:+ start:584 stop:841 length:258 start_codon:yes stop_codon:yes gene_type:complete
MAALGLGLSGLSEALGSGSTAVVIEDYFWELVSAGNITPLASGTVSDFHDTWDLDSNDYMPRTTATVGDEGYWDLDGTNIRPLDV